ncbi:MAG TPA: RidA family protein [Acidimicrobiales bacterium]|jgi:enamine deaminase RidA (YjgF/YER057c/UK114 family)|nr:RidA family protein [Acidimicrobiales bacterium]
MSDPDPIQRLGHVVGAGMSQVVVAGNLAFVAGQVAMTGPDTVVGDGDVERQATHCFDAIDAALRAVGGRLTDVVRLTAYLVDATDGPAYLRVRDARFPSAAPATTTVIVAGLLHPRLRIELEATAVLPRARGDG